MTVRAAVFASGRGSNFQVLAERAGRGDGSGPWEVRLLITDKENAGALDRAEALGVPSRVVPVADRSQDEVGQDLLTALDEPGIDFVLLAGYMRLVPPVVVRAFQGRMLNLHPALLPCFGGKGMYGRRVHQAVLEAGVRVTGATVHFVDEEYDRGPILAQWPVPVLPGDTPETLEARVGRVEHRLYPAAAEALARALAEGREPQPVPRPPGPHHEHFRLAAGLPDLEPSASPNASRDMPPP